MKDLGQLLAAAFPEELEKISPAPVRKQALRDKAFGKLGLGAETTGDFAGEWAFPVPRKRRPWAAALCACLALAVAVGLAATLLHPSAPVASQPEHALPAGTYLELSVEETSFDEEAWAVVFTLEARTDLDLDNPNASTGYGLSAGLRWPGGVSLGNVDDAQVAHWAETGENTYRCQDITVEVDPTIQVQNRLVGYLDLEVNLFAGFGEQDETGGWPDFLTAQAGFSLEFPMPGEELVPGIGQADVDLSPGTYLELSVEDVAFDQEAWAIVFTLEARTDLELAAPTASLDYSFDASVRLLTLDEAGQTTGSFTLGGHDPMEASQWELTGENTFRCQGYTVALDPAFQAQGGPQQGQFTLEVGSGEENPAGIRENRLTAQAGFTVDLPDAQEAPGGLLSADQIATLESLYGQTLESVLEGLGLSQEDGTATEVNPQGVVYGWTMNDPVVLAGVEIYQLLAFEWETGEFFGTKYHRGLIPPEEGSQAAADLLEQALPLYGEPTTYPGLQNRLTGETFPQELQNALEFNKTDSWTETWDNLGDGTTFVLQVSALEGTVSLDLSYQQTVDPEF